MVWREYGASASVWCMYVKLIQMYGKLLQMYVTLELFEAFLVCVCVCVCVCACVCVYEGVMCETLELFEAFLFPEGVLEHDNLLFLR